MDCKQVIMTAAVKFEKKILNVNAVHVLISLEGWLRMFIHLWKIYTNKVCIQSKLLVIFQGQNDFLSKFYSFTSKKKIYIYI